MRLNTIVRDLEFAPMATATHHRAETLATQLAVLAHPHRVLILRHLRRGEQYAGRLSEALGISPSLTSHHLHALLAAEMVSRRQHGSYACYAARREALDALYDEFGKLMGAVVPEDALEAAEQCKT